MALTRKKIIIPQKVEEVDSAETLACLERLQQIANRPISLLTTEQCQDLERIRKLAHSVYDTPAYQTLYDHVMRLFSTEQSAVMPHTVAAFFIGCVVPSNLSDATSEVNAGCALLCSDSLPPPDKGWGFCSQNVIWCLLSSSAAARNARAAIHMRIQINHDGPTLPESFDFIYMTHVESSSKAILFVDYETYAAFPGFTRHEKARLIHRMRITDIKLLSYEKQANESGGLAYKDLIGKPVKVHSIKARSDPRDNETPAQREMRREKIVKSVASSIAAAKIRADSEILPTWSQSVILAFALFLLVVLVICSGFAMRALRSANLKRNG